MSDETTQRQVEAFVKALRAAGYSGDDLVWAMPIEGIPPLNQKWWAALAAAFRAAEAASWQPVETAPGPRDNVQFWNGACAVDGLAFSNDEWPPDEPDYTHWRQAEPPR